MLRSAMMIALFAIIGLMVAAVLMRVYPALGIVSSALLGGLAFLLLMGFYVLLSLQSTMREQEIKILSLRRDLGDAAKKATQAQSALEDISHEERDPRYDSLLGEVRIMQSVIDRVLSGAQPITENKAKARDAGASLNDKEVVGLLNDAIKYDNIEVFLQPVVSLPQRKLRFYEMFTRIRTNDGQLVTPDRYIKLAGDAGILAGIDNLQLLRCVQMIRDSDRRHSPLRFFCNISSATLRDTSFMTELVQFVAQNALLAPKLMFELSQSDLASMSADLVPVLDGLGRLGCRFSMDGVYSLDFPMAALSARKIRTVKIDAELLLSEFRRAGGREKIRRIRDDLDRNGIDLIASKIEDETILRELLDLNIDYGQGFLFGEPRANWPVT